MITINNKQYSNYTSKVTFIEYDWNKTKGISPFISFDIENKIFVGIETRLPKETLENINYNEKLNITEYLTDITYEAEKGWISIITGTYNCFLTKMDNSYKLELSVESNELEEKIKIGITSNINVII